MKNLRSMLKSIAAPPVKCDDSILNNLHVNCKPEKCYYVFRFQQTNMSHTKQHNNVSYKSDDGDEGDVSSDDSLRLKLSDDENTEAAEQPTNLQTPKREGK